MTNIPFDLLLVVVFWNVFVFGAGWYAERLLHRHHQRIARRVLLDERLPYPWREWIVEAIYWLYPLH